MELNLQRPLLFFDIESTGLNIPTDGIIELSFVKVFPGGEQRIKTWRVLPWDYVGRKQIHINPEAGRVNGIRDEQLVNCPKFYEIVDEVLEWLSDCDLAGFNSTKFDLPMLAEEIERVRVYMKKPIEVDLHSKVMVDVQNIYHKMEPRNLAAAYRFYCGGQDFDNAHAAEADTLATYEVLKGQIEMYKDSPEVKNDVDALARSFGARKTVDYAGRLLYNEGGEPIISFGKHKGRSAKDIYQSEPSYYDWIFKGEFTLDTKRQFALLKERYDRERREELAAKFNTKKEAGSLF